MTEFAKSTMLLMVLLNPFLVIVYLIDILKKLDEKHFRPVLVRAGIISASVFCCFAVLGDTIFSGVLQLQFASFQIFGGVVFLLIGIQFLFRGPGSIKFLRGESKHIAGAIAMPVLIGPGTISASVVIGQRMGILESCLAILLAVSVSLVTIFFLKRLHDYVRKSREELVERYFDIAGRITALFVGSVSIEMIMLGIEAWIQRMA